MNIARARGLAESLVEPVLTPTSGEAALAYVEATKNVAQQILDALNPSNEPLTITVFVPSLVRQALDELLRRYPMFDLVSIDWGVHEGNDLLSPWVLVNLGQPSASFEDFPAWAIWPFAIFRRTGALHSMSNGAVSDDPIWTP